MEGFYRDYREYLRGYISGLNELRPDTNRSLEITFISTPRDMPLKEAVQKSLLKNNWQKNEIQGITYLNMGDFRANLRLIIRGAIPNVDHTRVSETIITILNHEFGKEYNIYGNYLNDDDGGSFVFVLEDTKERMLCNLSWSYT